MRVGDFVSIIQCTFAWKEHWHQTNLLQFIFCGNPDLLLKSFTALITDCSNATQLKTGCENWPFL